MNYYHGLRSNIRQILLFAIGSGVVVYAICVLVHASSSYELGIRSILTPQVIGEPHAIEGDRLGVMPRSGDLIVTVGDEEIRTWADLLEAPGKIHHRLEDPSFVPDWVKREPQLLVKIEYRRPLSENPDELHFAWCPLGRFPRDLIPSLIWLFLKGALFVIGVIVFWKRPEDEAAVRFYILCVVTLGAYMGGYHWTQIVTQPVLSIVFMVCAVLLPVTSLHFYLVFPRKKAWLERKPLVTLAAIYGLPLANLACLIGFFVYLISFPDKDSALRKFLPAVIYVSFGLAMLWYLACMAALFHSVRTVEDPMARKQVRCILVGVLFSHIPIGLSLYIVLVEPARFVEGAVTWPMFGASLIVTLAFAIGMTRYRLMELDKIISAGMGYFLVSFLAGLMYYGVVFVGTLFYDRFIESPTLPAALTVSTAALIFVLVLDAARSRFQKALDRRFSRNKSQLDRTLEEMSQAVSQLVDPPALAKRLLSAVSDTLGITRGAIYLKRETPAGFCLAASRETAPPPSCRITPH